MGKDRTAKKNKGRHEPLYVQMEEDGRLSKKPPRTKFQAKKQLKTEDDVRINRMCEIDYNKSSKELFVLFRNTLTQNCHVKFYK